jgi:tetratricopeptide (TPR) repeat protein
VSLTPRDWLLAGATGLLILAGAAAWAVSAFSSRTSHEDHQSFASLREEVGRLASAKKFDEAVERVTRYLEHEPTSAPALLMMAELELDRPREQAGTAHALEWIRRVETSDPSLRAQAKFDEGRANYLLERFPAAESAWLEALRLNPTIGEAGWCLLDLYYLQGRSAEAQSLALRLHEVESDPHDRVQLLLELVRQDAQVTDPASVVKRFEPVVERDPSDLHSAIALGLALVRDHRGDQGLALLRRSTEAHQDDPDSWNALLQGLTMTSRNEELAQTYARLPQSFAEAPRFAQYRGHVAWERSDWPAAVRALTEALTFDPSNHEALYRLGRTRRAMGRTDDAEPLEDRARAQEAARQEVRALYDEANAILSGRTTAPIALYRRLADQRARAGRVREAHVWYRHILTALPNDAQSEEALKRLEATVGALEERRPSDR